MANFYFEITIKIKTKQCFKENINFSHNSLTIYQVRLKEEKKTALQNKIKSNLKWYKSNKTFSGQLQELLYT